MVECKPYSKIFASAQMNYLIKIECPKFCQNIIGKALLLQGRRVSSLPQNSIHHKPLQNCANPHNLNVRVFQDLTAILDVLILLDSMAILDLLVLLDSMATLGILVLLDSTTILDVLVLLDSMAILDVPVIQDLMAIIDVLVLCT